MTSYLALKSIFVHCLLADDSVINQSQEVM